MDRIAAEGVEAAAAHVDHDAGQVGRVDLDLRDLVPRQVLADRDGDESLLAPGLAQDPLAVVVLDRHQRCDFVQRLVEIQRCLGDNDQPIIQPVLRKHLAEAVEDAAPRRWQKLHVDAVLVREHLIALGIHDLKLIEAPGEAGRQQRLRATHDDRAAREDVGASRFAPHLTQAARRQARRGDGTTARISGRAATSARPARRWAAAGPARRSRRS